MTITIDNHGGTPIYDQVCRQIRAAMDAEDPLSLIHI